MSRVPYHFALGAWEQVSEVDGKNKGHLPLRILSCSPGNPGFPRKLMGCSERREGGI